MKKVEMDNMLDDPIVNEVRHAGQALFKDAGHDIHRLCASLKTREKCYANPVQCPGTSGMSADSPQDAQAFREDEEPYT